MPGSQAQIQAIAAAILAALAEANEPLTTREIIERCEMFVFSRVERCNGEHKLSNAEFISCDPIPSDKREHGSYRLHAIKRELWTNEVNPILAKLLLDGLVAKRRIERFKAVLWSLPISAKPDQKLEEIALLVAIGPAATAYQKFLLDDGVDPLDVEEQTDFLRDPLNTQADTVRVLIPGIKAISRAGMLVDVEALNAIHFPIEGYVPCPHSAIGEWCPEDSDNECIEYTAPGRNNSEFVVKRLICAHCLIGSAGSDRPHWLTDDDAGYFDHPVPDRGYADDMEHRVWPCPTAIALGLS